MKEKITLKMVIIPYAPEPLLQAVLKSIKTFFFNFLLLVNTNLNMVTYLFNCILFSYMLFNYAKTIL